MESGHYFYEPLDLSGTRPRVRRLLDEFLAFQREVDPDPEVVSQSALGNLDFSTSPLCLQALAPAASVYGGLEEFHDFFYVNENSDPEGS